VMGEDSEISATKGEFSDVELVDVEPHEKGSSAELEKNATSGELEKTRCHPLGELHLRIFAWACMVLSHVGTVMVVFGIIWASFEQEATQESESSTNALETAGTIVGMLQYCYMPLILIANFSCILRSRKSYLTSLLQYGGFTFGMLILYIFVYFHYIVSVIRKISGFELHDACVLADRALAVLFSTLRQFNVFVDLFICTLIAFFILYTPKHCFKGKLIYVFRSFVVIPLAWSILAFIFLGLNEEGMFIPGYLFPLIPLKPPIFLAVFISLVIFLKVSEQRFIRAGGSLEDYDEEFLKPKSAVHFSRFAAIALGVGSVVDFICLVIYFASDENPAMKRIGFGDSCLMFVIIPIVLFFDFRKSIKNSIISLILPIVSIALIVLIWVEAVYWISAILIDLVMEMIGDV